MTPEEALITILRLIDDSDEVNDEKILQLLRRCAAHIPTTF